MFYQLYTDPREHTTAEQAVPGDHFLFRSLGLFCFETGVFSLDMH